MHLRWRSLHIRQMTVRIFLKTTHFWNQYSLKTDSKKLNINFLTHLYNLYVGVIIEVKHLAQIFVSEDNVERKIIRHYREKKYKIRFCLKIVVILINNNCDNMSYNMTASVEADDTQKKCYFMNGSNLSKHTKQAKQLINAQFLIMWYIQTS